MRWHEMTQRLWLAGSLLVLVTACAEPKPLAEGTNPPAATESSGTATPEAAPSSTAPSSTQGSGQLTTTVPPGGVSPGPAAAPASGVPTTPSPSAAPSSAAPSMTLPAHFPDDFPVYPAANVESTSEPDQIPRLSFKTSDQPQQMVTYYAQELSSKGWTNIDSKLITGPTQVKGRVFGYKDDRIAQVSIDGPDIAGPRPGREATVHVAIGRVAQLPDDVPAPPNARPRHRADATRDNKLQKYATYEIAGPSPNLYDFYVAELTARGWENVNPENSLSTHGWVTAEKGNREIMVDIYNGLDLRRALQQGESSVTIIISEPAAAQ